MSVSRDASDPSLTAVAATLGVAASAVVQVHQVHGADVLVVANGIPVSRADRVVQADAIVSDDPLRAIGVRVADCAPILIGDRLSGRVAAVHAGWRGTAARVAPAAIRALERLGSRPADCVIAIGPSIGSCCYEVGPEVKEAFLAAGHPAGDVSRWFREGAGDRWQLDVTAANRDQLLGLGVPGSHIHVSGLCTACHPEVFHSYRRSKTGGRMLGLIKSRL